MRDACVLCEKAEYPIKSTFGTCDSYGDVDVDQLPLQVTGEVLVLNCEQATEYVVFFNVAQRTGAKAVDNILEADRRLTIERRVQRIEHVTHLKRLSR